MSKWADYCISKLSLNENGFIDSIVLYIDDGNTLDPNVMERSRAWMVQQVNMGKTFCSIKKNNRGRWDKLWDFSYTGSIFSWYTIPKNLPCRKTFVSFYHKDDQEYRETFDALFDDLITNKSVEDGDIDSDNGDDYSKKLIQNGYLDDTTMLVVLIGPKTKCRKHIDWEIYGALDQKVGDRYAGLLGLFLPSHLDYGVDKYHPSLIPERLEKNVESGYAILRDWTEDRVKLQGYVEDAFARRSEFNKMENKSIIQMTKNTCE